MVKQDLLDKITSQRQAVDHPERHALAAARFGDSDADVEARVAVLRHRRKTLTRVNFTAVLLAQLAYSWFAADLRNRGFEGAGFALVAFGAFVVAILALLVTEVAGNAVARLEQLFWFEGIAGSFLCESGLGYVKQSEWARQWRDTALRERSELRRFDIHIMAALAEEQQARALALESDGRLTQACKELHAIPLAIES